MQSPASAKQLGSSRYALLTPRPAAAKPSRRALRAWAIAAPEKAGPKEGPTVMNKELLQSEKSVSQHRLELIQSMDKFAEEQVLPILKAPAKCWQPTDYLPLPESPDFVDQVTELRKRCEGVPPEYFVVLVGDMITEEALPTYMAMLNTLDGVRDETGSDPTPWGRWTRQWVAEENRHGDLMNKYCYLSGKVNMRAVEITIQNLIGSGMNPKTEQNPYNGFIYTSFQERATKVSHGNTARQAIDYGDEVLGKLCGAIASDESRHEIAYTRIVDEFFRLDPDGAMVAFADMMRKQIVMPAHLMDDNEHAANNGGKRNLFNDYSEVAEHLGVYNASDYTDIMEHLIARWNINGRTGLGEEAAEAQDYLMQLPGRIRKLSERATARKKRGKPSLVKFSWIFNKELEIY